MDPIRFDALTRALGQARGRRQLITVLSALPIVGVVVGLPSDDAEAERPQDRLRRRKTQKRHKQRNRKGHNNGNNNNNNQGGSNKKTKNKKKNTAGGLGNPQGCALPGQACQQNRDCCQGNCFGQVCADPPNRCGGTNCPGDATGCCPVDDCCSPPANQCNAGGLCCAPNCEGKQCGPDGCGNSGTCGSCAPGQTCDLATAQCEGAACNALSCANGCCDGNGACQPGTTNQQCGRGGIACFQCSQFQFCSSETGTCRDNPPCSAATCPNGCCEPQPNGPDICRTDRRGCGPRAVCCDGCCDGNGACQAGNDDGACGAGGSRCIVCDPFQGNCDQGRCQCDANNCPGCCPNGPGNKGFCEEGETNDFCGVGGEQCIQCPTGTNCTGQGECRCNANSCPAGTACCTDTTRCQSLNGGACSAHSDCCEGNCWEGVCSPQVTTCDGNPCGGSVNGCAGGECCGGSATFGCTNLDSTNCCAPPARVCCVDQFQNASCCESCIPMGGACNAGAQTGCCSNFCCQGRCCDFCGAGGTACEQGSDCCSGDCVGFNPGFPESGSCSR